MAPLNRLSYLLVFCLWGSYASTGWARPDWIAQPPRADGAHKFYLGRSSGTQDESTGFNEATRDAYEQAIRENFGFRTRVNTESYESLDRSHTTKRIQELSRHIEIHDFEQMSSHTEAAGGGRLNVWVLYRYSKSAIEREKQRQASLKDDELDDAKFNVTGEALENGTALEIRTHPSGATVEIDGQPAGFAKTPIKILGTLSVGRHTLRLDHPRFQALEEEVILVPGKVVRVDKTLLKARGRLTVVTDPPDANVVIGGRAVGLSPTDPFSFEAGVPIVVEISHADTEKITQEVTLERGKLRELAVRLPRKPGATVRKRPIGTSRGSLEASESDPDRVEAKGGGPLFTLGLNAGGFSDTLAAPTYGLAAAFGVQAAVRLVSVASLGVFLSAEGDYFKRSLPSGSNLRMEGWRAVLGLPISLGDHFAFAPECILLERTFTGPGARDAAQSALTGARQTGFGATLSGVLWFDTNRFESVRFGARGSAGLHVFGPAGTASGTTSYSLSVGLVLGIR